MVTEKQNKLEAASVGRLLFKLAVPAITAQLVNMLYNIVDRIYIGHMPEVGAKALTGVGLCFPIILIISAFSSLVGMGGAPLAAIKMGEKKYNEAEEILGNCVVALIVFAVILTAFFLTLGERLLVLFGASGETLPYALEYLTIYVSGTIFVQLSLGLNAFITTQGFANTAMLTVVIGAVANIILDPIFMFGFDLGVRGAAIATVISQALSAYWVVRFLLSEKTTLKIRWENLRVRRNLLGQVLLLGSAPFVMQSTESLLSMAFNFSLQRYGGDLAVGAMTILSSLMQMLVMPLSGLTQGSQPIISYNYGAKRYERVKQAFRLLFIYCVGYAVVFWLVMLTVPAPFVAVFTTDPLLTQTTVWALRVYIFGAFAIGAQIACQQTFLALGQAKVALFLALLRKIILLIPLIFILPQFFADKVLAVFLAEPVADILAAATTVTMFMLQAKKILSPSSAGTLTKPVEGIGTWS